MVGLTRAGVPHAARLAAIVPAWLCCSAVALAMAPSLGNIQPRGGQRGTEMDLVLSGARLADAQEVLLYYPGVEVTGLEAVDDNQVKVHVKIAEDCRLGEHALRLRTATGLTELRTFYVGALPQQEEAEENGDLENAQKVELNTTIAGVVQNEDVDFFAFEAKKGQRINAEIEGMRLGTTMFDPFLAILDAERFELAAADDTPLVWQDAVVSVVIPEDGTYYAEVRESAYGGNGNCTYRLHLGTFPRPTATLPAGGKLGEEVEVRFLGDAGGEFTQRVALPAEPDPNFGLFAQDEHGIAPSANVFRLSEHGNVLEAEPNNKPDEATPAELPLALGGVISEPGDVDFFRFHATKGQTFDVHCFARRLRTPLDPVMHVYVLGGKSLAGNDDSGGLDSYFRFQAPEDGDYALRIADHLGRGGPDFAYRVEFQPVTPKLSLSIPKVARYSQERQIVVVPRGNRYATLVNASRANFGGDLTIHAEGLPEGVTLTAPTMPANLNVVPVLFEAAADAPVAGSLAQLLASHADPAQNIHGGLEQVTELVYGPPNNRIYWTHTIDRLAVAVAEEVPFRLRVVEPKVPLVQNGSMELKVVAERQEGFTAPINVQMPFRPPGVGAATSVTIPEGQNEVLYPINANSNAQVRDWPLVVLGSATVGNGPAWISSQLATLKVAPPYVQFAMQRAAVEQGQQTEIFCKIEHSTPFEGAAKVRVLGLPPKTTAPDLEITKETGELAIQVATAEDSPAGQHKNIFCQLVVTENGEPIVHRVGGTELRIDKPLPPKKDEPAVAEKQPDKPKEPPPKRLSRLEKLRLEQQQRIEAARADAGAPAQTDE
ncbi:MAG: PPC domain-containing protein [Pirellulales bacterium]